MGLASPKLIADLGSYNRSFFVPRLIRELQENYSYP